MTPLEYLIPRMDVPVTIGRRVRSVALDRPDVVEEARGAPPEERLRDIMMWIMSKKRWELKLNDEILENVERSVAAFSGFVFLGLLEYK